MPMLGLVGVTSMDTSVASVTVIGVLLETLPNDARIVAVPVCCPYTYACPLPLCDSFTTEAFAEVLATSLNIAMAVLDELQVTEPVRSFFELSE